MRILLTLASALEVLGLVAVVVYFLNRIIVALEKIGGNGDSSLARVSFGVRAISKETSHLAPQVVQLNTGLAVIAGKLGLVDEHLKSVADALTEGQEARA